MQQLAHESAFFTQVDQILVHLCITLSLIITVGKLVKRDFLEFWSSSRKTPNRRELGRGRAKRP